MLYEDIGHLVAIMDIYKKNYKKENIHANVLLLRAHKTKMTENFNY